MAASENENSRACATYRIEKSKSGLSLSLLKSAIQKYVRRSETEKALQVASELWSFKNATGGERDVKRVMTNIRHRLMIITLEDCMSVDTLMKAAEYNRDFTQLNMYKWVWLLTKVEHGRMCSHANALTKILTNNDYLQLARDYYPDIAALHDEFVYCDPQTGEEENIDESNECNWIPEFCDHLEQKSILSVFWLRYILLNQKKRHIERDKHTTKVWKKRYGRKTKPAWHLLAAMCDVVDDDLLNVCEEWYKDIQNTKESFLCLMFPLLATLYEWSSITTLYAGRFPGEEDAGIETAALIHWCEEFTLADFTVEDPCDLAHSSKLDSYVYDMHVARRRKKGDLVRFALEGSYVTNESSLVNVEWRHFYEDCKRIDDGIEPVGHEE